MQVQSLGASQFSGWDKRDWEKKRNRNMGMKAQKNQKSSQNFERYSKKTERKDSATRKKPRKLILCLENIRRKEKVADLI